MRANNSLRLLIVATVVTLSMVILSCGDDDGITHEPGIILTPEQQVTHNKEMCKLFGLNYDDFEENHWLEQWDDDYHWFGNLRKSDNRFVLAYYDKKRKLKCVNSDIEVKQTYRLQGVNDDYSLLAFAFLLYRGNQQHIASQYVKNSFLFLLSCKYGIDDTRYCTCHFIVGDGKKTSSFSIEGGRLSYEATIWYNDSWLIYDIYNKFFCYENGKLLYRSREGWKPSEGKSIDFSSLFPINSYFPVNYSQVVVRNNQNQLVKMNLEKGIEEWRIEIPDNISLNKELILEDNSSDVWVFGQRNKISGIRFTLNINTGELEIIN